MFKNEKGLTLIEVLASIAILSVAILAYTNISGYTSLANLKSSQSVEALRIAEKQLGLAREYFRISQKLPPDKVKDNYSISFQGTDLADADDLNISGLGDKHISLQGIVAANTRSKVITVTVTWSD